MKHLWLSGEFVLQQSSLEDIKHKYCSILYVMNEYNIFTFNLEVYVYVACLYVGVSYVYIHVISPFLDTCVE